MGVVNNDILDLSFSKVPMVKPLCALIVGIVIGQYIALPAIPYYPYFIIICFLLLLITQLKKFVFIRKQLFSIVYYVLITILGIWLISVNKPDVNDSHFSNFNAVQLVGIVDDEPRSKEKTIRFPLRVMAFLDTNNYHHAEGRLMVTILKDSLSSEGLRYGDVIVLKNTITETSAPLNPNEFDYKNYLANKEIWHQCFLTYEEYMVIANGKGNFILEKSLSLRQELIAKLGQYVHNPEAFQIAIALLFGYRSELENTTLEAFRDTGTIHVLSVSGLHVSLVFGLLTLVLMRLDRLHNGKVIRCTIIFIAVWVYVVLTGMSPPILRAGIMISFFIFSTVSGRQQISVNTLMVSAFFILFLAPQYLFDVGFQLSYAAILGILLLFPILKEVWLPSNRWCSIIIEYCYISIAAQLFTMPLALYYFGQFPVYFLIANLFIAFPSTIIMYIGITLTLSPIAIINVFLGRLLDWIIVFSLQGLQYIAHLPMSVYRGIVWDSIQVLLLTMALIFLILALNYVNKKMMVLTLITLFVLSTYTTVNKLLLVRYKGYRIYSVRSDIAIAYVDKGSVVLYSTFDSIQHASLQFSVWPDLNRFADIEDVFYVSLPNDKRNNYELELGEYHFLIVENFVTIDTTKTYDFILWRKNNRNDISAFRDVFPSAKVIVDGSNSQKTIAKFQQDSRNPLSIYVLKNNFAYVWDGE